MKERISKVNLKEKEVNSMKKYAILFIFFMVLAVGSFGIQPNADAAPILVGGTENNLFFQNVEIIYRPATSCAPGECFAFDAANDPVGWRRVIPVNSQGPGTGSVPRVDDVIIGIFNVQNIEANGLPTWGQDITSDQLSGYFTQRIAAITLNDPSAGIEHLTLDSTVDPWGILPAGTMFGAWVDDGPAPGAFSAYETDGSISDDIAKATNGSQWATLTELGGYGYGHVDLELAISNFSDQEAFFALDFVINNTGWDFLALNDINESEIGGTPPIPPFLMNDLVGTAELEVNPGFLTGTSPWVYRSNDPFTLQPIPEPSTILLLAAGLLGLGFSFRRKG